jgi:hypothetical protein
MSSRQKQETPRHSLSRTHINTDVENPFSDRDLQQVIDLRTRRGRTSIGDAEAGAGSMTEARKVSRHRC